MEEKAYHMDNIWERAFFQHKIYVIIPALVVLTLACSIPGSLFEIGDQGVDVETQIAQTMAARPAEKQRPATNTASSPTDTATPAVTETPAPTATLTFTPTPESASVSVTGDTFCRSGPGSVYDQSGIMNTDEESQLLAKDPTGNFWYIVNPDDSSQKCWIWGKYATPDGPTAGLPVYTPPPTPTPSLAFSADYNEPHERFMSKIVVWFVIKNTGGVSIESVSTYVEGYMTGVVTTPVPQSESYTSNAFYDNKHGSENLVRIKPGNSAFTISGVLGTTDRKMNATVKVCTQDNLNGECATRSFVVQP